MKQPTSRSDELLQAMASLPVPDEDGSCQRQRREQVVASLSSVIREERRALERRRRWRPVVGALLAAACVLISIGAWRTFRGSVVQPPLASDARLRAIEGMVLVARGGQLNPVTTAHDVVLSDGDEIRTSAQARAAVVFASGVLVDVGSGTSLSVGPSHDRAPQGRERLIVTLGRVDLTVPKLPTGQSFAVITPDAEVVVHGTRFSVTVATAAPPEASMTSVQVTEGRVSVHHSGNETVLMRGDSWPSQPSPPRGPPAGTEPSPPEVRPAASTTAVPPAGARPARSSDEATASSLAQENRLFQLAMEARRRGDDHAVVKLLDELLATYPSSPLSQTARVERFRALKRLGDDAAAAREARRYLAEDPDGFARDEARDTVLTPRPANSSP